MCTICDNDLNKDELIKNEKYKNYTHPVCDKCLNSTVKSILSLKKSLS